MSNGIRVKKELRISDLEKSETGPVWVLNQPTTTSRRTRVLITCAKLIGQGSDSVIVPPTFIPLDLTEQVTKAQLLMSSEFRRAVARGLLFLITEDQATDILSTRDAQREMKRLEREADLVKKAAERDGIAINNDLSDEEKAKSEEIIINPNASRNNIPESEANVSAAVLAALANPDNLGEDEVLANLMNLGELATNELEYVAAEAQKNNWGEMNEWAQEQLEA